MGLRKRWVHVAETAVAVRLGHAMPVAAMPVAAMLVAAMFVVAMPLVSCSKPWPVDTPPPPVQPAPVDLQSLAIHVHQLASPPVSKQDKWDYENMSGLTGELRRAVVAQLQRAGYKVVVDRNMSHDLLALIQAEWPNERAGTATLQLSIPGGETVATFSAAIPMLGEPPRTEHLEGDAAVSLVDSMSRSPELFRFSHKVNADRASAEKDPVIAE